MEDEKFRIELSPPRLIAPNPQYMGKIVYEQYKPTTRDKIENVAKALTLIGVFALGCLFVPQLMLMIAGGISGLLLAYWIVG